MANWITVHWPPREDESISNGTGIWLPDGRQAPGATITKGDLVFIYQAQSGRPVIRQLADGTTRIIRCKRGREGVVQLARVSAPLAADPDSKPEKYSDGTQIWWRWSAPAEVVASSGFVPRDQVAAILGYKSNYNFRGFGQEHSGLRELSEVEFSEIKRRYQKHNPLTLKRHAIPHRQRGGHGGGESIEHKELKEFVSMNPTQALGEEGLRTIRVEYPFSTGDRADIVLADAFDRIIGVEIEPKVDNGDEVGILQAIKYRRMLELSANRSCGESRSFLVAYRISNRMKLLSAKYEVECYEIPRARVDCKTRP